MRVLSIIHDGELNGCDAYRAVYPLHQAELAGHVGMALPRSGLRQYLGNIGQFVGQFDLVQLNRLYWTEELKGFFHIPTLLRARGIACTCDYDDDFTNDYRKVHEGELKGLEAFSAITVSTPYLKKVMSRYHHRVHLIPNAVVPELFQGFKRLIPQLTIGLTGSATHTQDWKPVYAPLRRVLERHPEVRLFISGFLPEEWRGHPQVVTTRDLMPDPKPPDDNFFLPIRQYGVVMVNTDILLCPVDPADYFNHSKSNIKALEGMIARRPIGQETGGCAVIATGDVPNYRDAVLHNRTGLLVDHLDEAGWEQALLNLIENSAWRARLSVAGYQHASKYFTQEARLAERISVWNQIVHDDQRDKEKNKVQTRVAALVDAPEGAIEVSTT